MFPLSIVTSVTDCKRSTNCQPQTIWIARGGSYDLISDERCVPAYVMQFPIGVEHESDASIISVRMFYRNLTHVHTYIKTQSALHPRLLRESIQANCPFTRPRVNYYFFFIRDISRRVFSLTIFCERDTRIREVIPEL